MGLLSMVSRGKWDDGFRYTPPAQAGLCRVQCSFADASQAPLSGVTVTARLVSTNVSVPQVLLDVQTLKAVSGTAPWVAGYAELFLIQQQYFVKGHAVYELVATNPAGKVFMKFQARMPNLAAVNLETLLKAF